LEVSKGAAKLIGFADPDHIRQVVVNLILNAREALGASGSIVLSATVKAPSKRGDPPTTDRLICLSVSDNGPGIETRLLAHLFQPYVTTKASTKKRGLGLTMVKTLVELNKGTVSVTSARGVGTTFTITIPATTRSAKERNVAPKLCAANRRLSILVADDQPEIRDTLMRALVARGHQVLAVPDGSSLTRALAQQEYTFDVLLVDDGMPGSTGAGLIKSARELALGIPIILTSGNPTAIDSLVPNARHKRFLAKPFSLNDLYEAVESESFI
jgi:CheY-like chemotaxis protein/anti-sigma regulatory factor (Ser/Thr protein kinase)